LKLIKFFSLCFN